MTKDLPFSDLTRRAQAVQPVESTPGLWDIYRTRLKGAGFRLASGLATIPTAAMPLAGLFGTAALVGSGILPVAAAIGVGAVATIAATGATLRFVTVPLTGISLEKAQKASWDADAMSSKRYNQREYQKFLSSHKPG